MTATEARPMVQQNEANGAKLRGTARKTFMPLADIYETKDAFVIVADMPGVDDKSLDITLEKNVLTIRGSVEAFAPAGYKAVYAEYDEGDYERAFTLTDEIDREGIQASIKSGVMSVTLPKAAPAKARKIEVKS